MGSSVAAVVEMKCSVAAGPTAGGFVKPSAASRSQLPNGGPQRVRYPALAQSARVPPRQPAKADCAERRRNT